MKLKLGVRFVFALFLPAAVLSGNQLVDSYNVGQTQAPNTDWNLVDIGWYYTPSISYSLAQFETEFTQSTAAGDTDRTVTMAIFSDRPAVGGVQLGSTTFSSGPRFTFVGGTFGTPIPLVGGTTYFVALENVLDLGVNQVSFNFNGGAGPNGSVSPGGARLNETYLDNGGAQFATEGSNGSSLTWFDKPVIEFLSPNSATPEPGSLILLTVPLGLLILRRRRSR